MFKVLDEVCVPERGTKYSAYVGLFSREDVTIGAGGTILVSLGVKIDLSELFCNARAGNLLDLSTTQGEIEDWENFLKSHYLELSISSSLAVKGLIAPNDICIIDLDYSNEIGLIVHNPIDSHILNDFIRGRINEYKIKKGDRVAQCTLKEHKSYLMGYESDVVRDGGFGRTGQ